MSSSLLKYTACFSRLVAKDFQPIAITRPAVLISLTDPNSQAPELNGNWDDIIALQIPDNLDLKDEDRQKLSQIYDFILHYRNGSIFAHCEAGISRSGAMREFLSRCGWIIYPIFRSWQTFPNPSMLSVLSALNRANTKDPL